MKGRDDVAIADDSYPKTAYSTDHKPKRANHRRYDAGNRLPRFAKRRHLPNGTAFIRGIFAKGGKAATNAGQPIEAPLGGQCFFAGETIHIHWQLASIGAEAIHKYPHLLASQSFFGRNCL